MKRILIVSLTLALAAISLHAADQPDPRLEFLKQLDGTWTGNLGAEMGEGVFEFHITAGGSAVEEREMIGTPMEMLTVYHMDGADLVGTHYCMLGNQPKVLAAAKVVDNTLKFNCDGNPGNTASHDEQHIHGWSIHLDDAGKLHMAAQMVVDGKVIENPTTVLTRR